MGLKTTLGFSFRSTALTKKGMLCTLRDAIIRKNSDVNFRKKKNMGGSTGGKKIGVCAPPHNKTRKFFSKNLMTMNRKEKKYSCLLLTNRVIIIIIR